MFYIENIKKNYFKNYIYLELTYSYNFFIIFIKLWMNCYVIMINI